ncbi:hypothetical protein JHK87_042705 [Glycine soja]|nr:hypothetical protein JHK87_042705 [Glycine soja]
MNLFQPNFGNFVLTEEIKNARLVANPGCYPTSVQLPLVPFIKDEEFVVMLENGAIPQTHSVKRTNYGLINVFLDQIPGRAIIISVGGPQDGSTSKKRSVERQEEDRVANGFSGRDFKYYLKVIRWLECEGHIEKNFRHKFLTWHSLRATSQEVRIAKIYIDTFLEDPTSLAEQLVDTF